MMFAAGLIGCSITAKEYLSEPEEPETGSIRAVQD